MYRIGVMGYNGNSPAKTLDEVTAGILCLWVELPSGARIEAAELQRVRITVNQDGLIESTIVYGPDEANHKAEVDMAIAPHIVYCDRDGNPLPEKVSV